MISIIFLVIIIVLCDIFSRYGFLEIFVFDNGLQFSLIEFEWFCVNNGIMYCIFVFYKLFINGQVE